MSRNADVEAAYVARTVAISGSPFAFVARTRKPMQFVVPADGYPACLWFFRRFRKVKSETIVQQSRTLGGMLIGCLILPSATGIATEVDEADADLAYTLADQVRANTLGFQPIIAGLNNTWPTEIEDEYPVDVGYYMEWLLPTKFMQGVL
jgi:hypothetical protein